jgi:hypothetical protein
MLRRKGCRVRKILRGAKPPFGNTNLPQDLPASLRQPEIAKLDGHKSCEK